MASQHSICEAPVVFAYSVRLSGGAGHKCHGGGLRRESASTYTHVFSLATVPGVDAHPGSGAAEQRTGSGLSDSATQR